MEITANTLIAVVRPIIEAEIPEELIAYNLGAEECATRIIANSQQTDKANPAEFGFLSASAAADVLEFVKLLSATFGFLTTVIAWSGSRQKDDAELKQKLTKDLVRAGLPKSKAEFIGDKYAAVIAKKGQINGA
ncbi:MAG: hypothetical protein LAO76_12765 [Acidobacteriia bacterium]|nr:hypothetical protein [Terriglobia bacterium]